MSLNTTAGAVHHSLNLGPLVVTLTTLPSELVLMIIGDTSLLELVPLICALWKTLRQRGMIRQDMPMVERRAMEQAVLRRSPAAPGVRQLDGTTGLGSLPLELMLIVADGLDFIDRTSFAIATWRILYPPGR